MQFFLKLKIKEDFIKKFNLFSFSMIKFALKLNEMKHLYITAFFQFKENHLMDAIELFRKLVFETRKEDGCIQYDLVEDIENKGVFFIAEIWESVEHHHQHNGTDHLLKFRQESARMLEKSAEVYKGFKTF